MNLWKKIAVSLAATSMVILPVAASAAPAPGGARALSTSQGANDLEGASWLPIILALAVIAGGVWLAVDGDNDDEPVSP